MSVIPLTVFLSLALAFVFVLLFWREQRRRVFGGSERESLLPLADESSRPASPVEAADHHHHDDAAGGCGCRSGRRPPCAGCRREPASVPTR